MQVASSMSISASYVSVSVSTSRASVSQNVSKAAEVAPVAKPEPKQQPDVTIEVGKTRKGRGDDHGRAHGHDKPRYGGGLAGRLVRRMDENRDGGVSLQEAQESRLGRRISEEKFNKIDGDSDGLVTAKELRSHFRKSLFGDRAQKPAATDDAVAPAKPETGSANSVAQIASQQALASVTSVSVSVSVASASYSSASGSFGGQVGDAAVPQEPMVGKAPVEQAPVQDKEPSAAMVEAAKIKAEAAAREADDVEDGDDIEIDDLGDLMEMMASGALDDMDPMKLIEEVAELMGVELDADGDDDDDGLSIGSLGGEVDANFSGSEVSLEAFSFEASLTTATFADGSSATSMSVNFTAISAYSRTMEFSAAA